MYVDWCVRVVLKEKRRASSEFDIEKQCEKMGNHRESLVVNCDSEMWEDIGVQLFIVPSVYYKINKINTNTDLIFPLQKMDQT